MRRQLLPALTMLLVFTVITGIVYPLAVTGVGQLFFGDQANGALLERDGQVIGSAHIGQQFTAAKYFHPRPRRQATVTTLRRARAPTWDRRTKLLAAVAERVTAYRKENNLPADTLVPVDAVTGSGSGLDPAISVVNAKLQAPRVAQARNISIRQVERLIEDHTDARGLGFLGERAVNVLRLNLALDRL